MRRDILKPRWLAAIAVAWLYTTPALAHSFGKLYNLPIPFWLYLYAAAAALLLSFLVIGYFVSEPPANHITGNSRLQWIKPGRLYPERRLVQLLKVLSVAGLALTIASGVIGTQFSYYNFNMTFFWVIFVLGFTYLSAVIGNFWAVINPWKVLVEWAAAVTGLRFEGRLPYPNTLGYYPALFFYFAFIWFELFGHGNPFSLSVALILYSTLNILGAWLVGKSLWFERCEFFSVFFRLIAMASPVEVAGSGSELRLRQPFVGLLKERPEHFSLLLFVLFMLSSTAFDGLHETQVWGRGFWVHIYGLLTPVLGSNIVDTYPTFRILHALYECLGLLLSPFFYLLIYISCIAMSRRIAGSSMTLSELALRFAYTLVPIALVYNISHYFTLLVSQGTQIIRLASDPFGFGWNLFGTAHWLTQPVMVDMGIVWHTQVALIIAGHIVSVYLAHLEALKLFPTRRQAIISQIPMLFLMMAYTCIGLWILSQPISSGQTAAVEIQSVLDS